MAAPWRGGGPNDGWNDPPVFNYNATSSQTHSPSRSHLNKRVAYPLSHGNGNTGSQGKSAPAPGGTLLSPNNGPPKLSPIQILPPTSTTSVHPPVPLLVPNVSPPVDASALPPSFASAAKDPFKSETLPELLERLQLDDADSLRKYTKRILHETLDKLKDSIQGRSREDVQQRLGVLDDQWRDDKLSEGAKVKLGCLASAVQNDDLKCADALHLSLMVDHISEVSQWMVGVKRVINELKLLQPPPATPPKVGEDKLKLFPLVTNFSVNSGAVSGEGEKDSVTTDASNNSDDLKFDTMPNQEQRDTIDKQEYDTSNGSLQEDENTTATS